MSREICVHLVPSLLDSERLRGTVSVVIDLLRASTTITTALENGASNVLPCREVSQAQKKADELPHEQILLGGERQGKLIEGFDLDNSPSAYTPERVDGKTIIFTTTNGTAAIERAAAADRVLIGCFANINALIDLLIRDGRPVHLICAGTDGAVSLEDVMCAGAIATGIWAHVGNPDIADDSALMAMTLFDSAAEDAETYQRTLRQSRGARNLSRIGLEKDIEIASRWDTCGLVPEYSQSERSIRPALDVLETFDCRLRPPAIV